MTASARTVAIDCFPERLGLHMDADAIVGVDVIRATTTAVTAVALGRRCYPVPSIEAALPLAARLDRPLLVGELGGNVPYGFHLDNSPVAVSQRTDTDRPMILLSTSGTRVLTNAATSQVVYVACLRNVAAQVRHLIALHAHVALIGAGARGEFREEDQLCCARIGAGLVAAGYEPQDEATKAVLERWRGAADDAFVGNASTEYLRATDHLDDLDFILGHVDDLDCVFVLEGGEVVARPVAEGTG